jgi:DNA polymerase-3 subunit epsilon
VTWHMEPMVPFDLETDLPEPKLAHPVTAYMAVVDASQEAGQALWGETDLLINPEVEIPEEASKIHGITTEYAAEHGIDKRDGIRQITRWLIELTTAEGALLGLKLEGEWDTEPALTELAADLPYQHAVTRPIVGMNVSYDMTILHRDALRNETMPFLEICRRLRILVPCIDVYVLDKKADRYRPGFRNLGALCEAYGVRHDKAHEARADALAAARVAIKLARIAPWLADMDLTDLHASQVKWRREQCVNLQAYFRRSGKPQAVVDPCWPTCLPENHPEENPPDKGLFDV